MFYAGIVITLLSILASTGFAENPAMNSIDDIYEHEIEVWRAAQDERMRSPTGWLALTGHFWLKQGVNRIGASDLSEIRLPKDPPRGVEAKITLHGNDVVLECDESFGILVNGNFVSKSKLAIDTARAESDSTDKITIGDRLKLQLVRRSGRFAIRVRDSENEAIGQFKGKKWFPVRPDARVTATFTPFEPTRWESIINVKGDKTEAEVVGCVEFDWNEKHLKLDAMSEGPDDLFLIFKDQTNGKTTYGSGRFLNTTNPKDGKVILDFNKAYNPPCAFSPHTLCPIPPKQNVLDISIEAGERRPDDK